MSVVHQVLEVPDVSPHHHCLLNAYVGCPCTGPKFLLAEPWREMSGAILLQLSEGHWQNWRQRCGAELGLEESPGSIHFWNDSWELMGYFEWLFWLVEFLEEYRLGVSFHNSVYAELIIFLQATSSSSGCYMLYPRWKKLVMTSPSSTLGCAQMHQMKWLSWKQKFRHWSRTRHVLTHIMCQSQVSSIPCKVVQH